MIPDLILANARIRTMDPTRARAEALAVAGGRILAVGTSADMRALAGHGTEVIDAGGRLVLPGFQDAHVHLLDGGTDLVASAQLYDATDIAGLQAALAAHAARTSLPLVQGSGWQAGTFGDANLTAAVLDVAVPDRPCLAYDSSFHNACLNSAALAMAGITRDTPDPPNGHIVRDAAGNPTGMLHEDAIPWARDRLPAFPDSLFTDSARAAQAHANRHGITGVLDPRIVDYNATAYAELAAQDALTLRVAGAALVTPADTPETALARLTALRQTHPGPDFHVQSAKFFFDGVLENYTAALLAPFADTGGNAPVMFTPDQTRTLFTALDAARFQIHVHVIGDAAARAALDGFEQAALANGRWPARHQLAHLQVMHQSDIPRLAALGATANIQPLWACHDPVVPDLWMDTLGPARLPLTYAFRRMLDAGADWCLSSDWPVTTLNPFAIIQTAVTRQPPGGTRPPFFPAERLTVEEAVEGYTTRAAAACWREGFTGMLRPGFSADAIVLDRDIFSIPAEAIGDTTVLLTLFKGAEVWRASDWRG